MMSNIDLIRKQGWTQVLPVGKQTGVNLGAPGG